MSRQLDKLSLILRQAERASTEAEAEAFMAKAQDLATHWAIDLEIARQHVADKETRKVPVMREILIGQSGKRLLHTYVRLFLAIANANDITCDIASNSTKVYAFGFDSDIDVVEALYASLAVQMVTASDAYLRKGEYRNEGVKREVYRRDPYTGTREFVRVERKPVSGITARKSFQQAFAATVGNRLREARQAAIEAAEQARRDELASLPDSAAAESTGTELVLAAKSVEISDFYKKKSTASGSYRGGRSSTASSSHARAAGRAAGSKARLGGERALGGGRKSIS